MAKQSAPQRDTVRRVMHEFKEQALENSQGGKVKSRAQATAIALHEAGASRDETPERNRRNLARTKAAEARGDSRAALYERATQRGIKGRSRMTKAELADALRR